MAKSGQSKYDFEKTYKVVMTKHNGETEVKECSGDKVPEIEAGIDKGIFKYHWVEEKYDPGRKHK